MGGWVGGEYVLLARRCARRAGAGLRCACQAACCLLLSLADNALPASFCLPSPLPCPALQAKDAMHHAYFDDLDRETVDALENPVLLERD